MTRFWRVCSIIAAGLLIWSILRNDPITPLMWLLPLITYTFAELYGEIETLRKLIDGKS